jgi:hypothetical protein
MLCVNMQTSFMHPPFGFALFYLRGVAPKEVKSSDIYWGALPWVGLQLIMVLLVAIFPQTVTAFLDKGTPGDTQQPGLIIDKDSMGSEQWTQPEQSDEPPQLDFGTPDEKPAGEKPAEPGKK